MKCTACGSELDDGAKFCPRCGEPVPQGEKARQFCTVCGAVIQPGTRFCTSCGAALSGEGPQKNDEDGQQPGGHGLLIKILLIMLLVVVIAAAAAAALYLMKHRDQDPEKSKSSVRIEETADEKETSAQTETEELSELPADEELAEGDSGEQPEEESVEPEEETAAIVPEVQNAAERILDSVQEIQDAVDGGLLDTIDFSPESGGVYRAYLAADGVSCVMGEAAYGTEQYRYYIEGGELIYACYEGGEKNEFYFSAGSLIRWVSYPETGDAVTEDLGSSDAYHQWESRVLEDAQSLSETLTEMMFGTDSRTDGEILEGSDQRYIDESELYCLSQEELRLARNEIYARHGRIFQDEMLSEYFSQFDWYEPVIKADQFTEAMLNAYEIANLKLIVAYEEKMGYR